MVQWSHQALLPDTRSAALGGLALDCSYFTALLCCSPLGKLPWPASEHMRFLRFLNLITQKDLDKDSDEYLGSLGGTFIIMYHAIVSN